MIEHFLIPFFLMFAMEFADKTQLLLLSLSSKIQSKIQIIVGAFFGFLLADGLLVYFGDYISTILPLEIVQAISGVIFIGFGVHGFLEEDEEENETDKSLVKKTSIYTTTLVVFLAEIGDKSQLGALVLGTSYNPHLAFLGIMLSLMTLSILTIFFGSILLKYIDKNKIQRLANIAFIVVGLMTLLKIIL